MFFFLSFAYFDLQSVCQMLGLLCPPLFVYSIYLKWAFPSFHIKMAWLIKRCNSSWEQNMDSVFSHSLAIFLLGIRLLLVTIAWKCVHQFLPFGCFFLLYFLKLFWLIDQKLLISCDLWMCLSFFFFRSRYFCQYLPYTDLVVRNSCFSFFYCVLILISNAPGYNIAHLYLLTSHLQMWVYNLA